ncbi:type II toxin-antitoxin system VapC family toxin [Candidatus Viridilinea mediisalina]|uniref:Ribonuclease VapC n=1 Tax=Candidatus Viridilinea mediisalina TaxID=2024553 RepID=A0A2A6RH65_9CHLR|nr:type II toxin-antitoxin system VapC family toxin [Candidatus Viridilinea mediisalina]PDW02362.1 PIN domain nuclease [Candidatus Viridilinea mediisalina]
MYLLDTNHISLIIHGQQSVIAYLQKLGATKVTTCTIVRGELLYMAFKSERQRENMQHVEQMLAGIEVFAIDEATADWYGTIKARLIDRFGPKERAKRRNTTLAQIGITDNDLWIAACAKRHGATLVSADRDFQRIQAVIDLRVVSWL